MPEPYGDLPRPREYRDKGVSIGDVDIITTDSSFSCLFGICAAADDPEVNGHGVPDGFEQVTLTSGETSVLHNMHPPQIHRGLKSPVRQ